MHLTGTIINVATILLGGFFGLLLGNRLPEKVRYTVMMALGLFTFAYGIRLFMQTGNALVVLISMLIGVLLGEWWRIEDALSHLGVFLERKFNRNKGIESAKFIRGFLSASLLFSIGPMAILGSIQDGLTGDYNTLVIKAIMDGFAAIAFASSLGIGVLFSSLVILVYQGGLSLLATQLQFIMSDQVLAEFSAIGGIMLIGIAVSSLLEVKKIRVANFLPGFIVLPLVIWIFNLFGIY
ncbi:MAG: DUF554 domain-containing protein [Chloroflexi bacterium HGW-Chloroflexi-2]|jgi:hypothetical protein|nr:MAG: DUF554 domain-containing protein [Chloroflexi bacterium HGW-Chloroflexi-2]